MPIEDVQNSKLSGLEKLKLIKNVLEGYYTILHKLKAVPGEICLQSLESTSIIFDFDYKVGSSQIDHLQLADLIYTIAC